MAPGLTLARETYDSRACARPNLIQKRERERKGFDCGSGYTVDPPSSWPIVLAEDANYQIDLLLAGIMERAQGEKAILLAFDCVRAPDPVLALLRWAPPARSALILTLC